MATKMNQAGLRRAFWQAVPNLRWRYAAGQRQNEYPPDVLALSKVPGIARQLSKVNADILRDELSGYGCWDDVELSDHAQNLQRLLWIACGDIFDSVA